jgi:zinc/manganese transport system substrate-binding protein
MLNKINTNFYLKLDNSSKYFAIKIDGKQDYYVNKDRAFLPISDKNILLYCPFLNRKWYKILIYTIFLSFTLLSQANAKINIFTCEPEWKALAQEIATDNAIIFSATNSKQDPHHIRAKPSLIAKIRRADLLICSGAELEIGWLPILLEKAKSDLQKNAIGNIMVADYVKTIQKPTKLDRSLGDLHPYGNPHTHLNPNNILIIAKIIKERLQKIDIKNNNIYQNNYDKFLKRWQKSMKKWQKEAKKLQNINIIAHHKSFSYLFQWLKINEIAHLEPKEGINPTIRHLKNILDLTKKEKIRFIIRASHEQEEASNWLSSKSGIATLILPFTVNESESLFDLFDNIIANLNNS